MATPTPVFDYSSGVIHFNCNIEGGNIVGDLVQWIMAPETGAIDQHGEDAYGFLDINQNPNVNIPVTTYFPSTVYLQLNMDEAGPQGNSYVTCNIAGKSITRYLTSGGNQSDAGIVAPMGFVFHDVPKGSYNLNIQLHESGASPDLGGFVKYLVICPTGEPS